jgi:hypothetical protein
LGPHLPFISKEATHGKEAGLLILVSMMPWPSYVEVSSTIKSAEMETAVEEFPSIISSRQSFLSLKDI